MTQRAVEQLRDALKVLAMPAEAQLQHVGGLHADLDEIALEFDDIAPVRASLLDAGEITSAQASAVDAVDRQLLEMSDAGPSRWTAESASAGEDWRKLRLLALQALDALA